MPLRTEKSGHDGRSVYRRNFRPWPNVALHAICRWWNEDRPRLKKRRAFVPNQEFVVFSINNEAGLLFSNLIPERCWQLVTPNDAPAYLGIYTSVDSHHQFQELANLGLSRPAWNMRLFHTAGLSLTGASGKHGLTSG